MKLWLSGLHARAAWDRVFSKAGAATGRTMRRWGLRSPLGAGMRGAALRTAALRTTALAAVLFSAAVLSAVIAGLSVQHAQAAVTLVYFRATAGQNQVQLTWETATELNNSGFYIQRSLQQSGPFTRVSTFVFAEGDPVLGAVYEYTDSGLENLVTYWYRLEAIDTSQNSQFTDPVAAVVGATPTSPPSLTPTGSGTVQATAQTGTPATGTPTTGTPATPTLTNTPVPTSANVPTSTFAPTNTFAVRPTATVMAPATATPAPPTPTSNLMLTPQAQPSGPTATLIPLPEVAVVFDTPTPEGGALATRQPASGALDKQESSFNSERLVRLWPFGALLALWGVLGGWFYLTARKLE